MLIRLSELRTLIRESFNPYYGYRFKYENGEAIVLLDDDDKMIAGAKVVGPETISGVRNCYVMDALWSSSPAATVTLLQTVLKTFGKIVPDRSTSPAAQALLKRWYDRHHDDGSIHPIVRVSEELPHLNAVYSEPPDGLPRAVSLIHPANAVERQELFAAFGQGFWDRYHGTKRSQTGTANLNYMLNVTNNIEGVLEHIRDNYENESVRRWVDANKQRLSDYVRASKHIRYWKDSLVRRGFGDLFA